MTLCCINILYLNSSVYIKEVQKEEQKMSFKFFPRFVKQSLTIYIFGDILHSLLKVLHWMIPTIFLLKKK